MRVRIINSLDDAFVFVRQAEPEKDRYGDQQGSRCGNNKGRLRAEPLPELRTDPGRREGDEAHTAMEYPRKGA